ncbi:MAG TPA: DUF3775 domain-containing protein [Alphaproteobacteria bacterium]|nr:DUF3775 domain-containing protein [Alphaproteobacteria bacterium]
MDNLSVEKACFIMLKAREFDAKVEAVEEQPGSNPTDEASREILEDFEGDLTYQELVDAIEGLNEDERAELIALVWVGRGSFAKDDWDQAIEEARGVAAESVARYLTRIPLLSDYLEQGLAEFDASCAEVELSRL